MKGTAAATRDGLIEWYTRNRARTQMLFDLLDDEAYYSQPIALRHPIVFYEGHLPAFSFNTLVRRALGGDSIDGDMETLFARGIDPDEAAGNATAHRQGWPEREAVRRFARDADARVLDALANAELNQPGHLLLDRAEAAFAILEHEVMHQETLLYMWHRLPLAQKRRPRDYRPRIDGSAPRREWVQIPSGRATLGVARDATPFAWDNELPSYQVDVPPFSIERDNVTNADFRDFVDAGGYRDPQWWRPEDWQWVQAESVRQPLFWEAVDGDWHWRGMFDQIPLPDSWPVYVSHAEAAAYARWRGARLPSESEFQRAAYGTPDHDERPFPWGDAAPTPDRGVFDFASWDPHPVRTHPAGRSAWGVDDLVGNGWEWTDTVFGPLPGFRPMPSYPEYSADFFDGEHFVMKGASPVTASELLRPTFRNWFRPRYPYVYATLRCVKAGE